MSLTCTMILGDCLEVMPTLERNHDFIFADIPYGVLNAAWDKRLPLNSFWESICGIKRPEGSVCVMATNPYSADVIASNRKNFSYDLIWIKGRGTGSFQAKNRPMRAHEMMLIFYASKSTYNPQMRKANRLRRGTIKKPAYADSVFGPISAASYTYGDHVYPLSWQCHEPDHARKKTHSSQKPLGLLGWLIRTYSNPGDNVLDPVSGSGTTAVASLLLGRNVVCIERDESYFSASVERVQRHIKDNSIDATVEVRT